MNVCIFCLGMPMQTPTGCTYGLPHDEPVIIKQEHKRDSALCVKCNLHPRNPNSKTNGCEHVYSD